jgi:hypothetical protein
MIHHFSHADAGAPVLNGVAGSGVSLLNACLVTGYGDKDPAGWTRPFVSGNVSVFRMPGGSERYFRVAQDGTQVPGQNHVMGVRGFTTMLDVDDGTEPMPTVDQRPNGMLFRTGNASGDTNPAQWHVMADDQSVLFFFGGGATTLVAINRNNGPVTNYGGFGDLARVANPHDTFTTAIWGPESVDSIPLWTNNRTYGGTGVNNGAFILRGYAGSAGAVPASARGDSSWVVGDLGRFTGGNSRTWADVTGVEPTSHVTLKDDGIDIAPRGHIPGILMPQGPPHLGWDIDNTITLGGETYLPIPIRHQSLTSYFICLVQLTGSWR